MIKPGSEARVNGSSEGPIPRETPSRLVIVSMSVDTWGDCDVRRGLSMNWFDSSEGHTREATEDPSDQDAGYPFFRTPADGSHRGCADGASI